MAYGDDTSLPTDLSDLTRYAEQAIGLWPYRNDRMASDHRAWMVPEPDKPNRLQLSDSHAQIEAGVQLGAAADMQIRAVAHDDPSRAPAQVVEDWCRALVAEHERRVAKRGGGEWKHLMLWSGLTRGWIVPRVLFNPADAKFPLAIALLDPMEVYPGDREDMECCIVHQYECTLGRLWAEWGKARITEALDSPNSGRAPDPAVTHEVTAFYTPTEFAVLVNNKWLKKPTPHGYPGNPVGVFLARGTAFRGDNQALRTLRRERGDTDDWERDQADRYIGTSLIHAIRIHERDNQAIANLNMDLLRGSARPPSVAYVQNPKDINRVPQEPNSTATLRVGEAYQRYPPDGAALNYGLQMATRGQGNIWQAGLNQPIMGDAPGAASGYEHYLMGKAGARVLGPYMAAYSRAWEFILGFSAQLYSRFGAQPMPYLVRDRDSGTVGLQKMQPWMLFDADYGLTVQFSELGFPDIQALAMVAVQLLDRGIVSHEWALDNLLHIDNPTQVRMQALRDQALKDPELMKMRMLLEQARDPMDPDLAMLAKMLLAKTVQEFQLSVSTPPQQPPLPGSGVPSMPGNAQLPNEVMQPGMPPNAPAPPGVADLAAGIPAGLALG